MTSDHRSWLKHQLHEAGWHQDRYGMWLRDGHTDGRRYALLAASQAAGIRYVPSNPRPYRRHHTPITPAKQEAPLTALGWALATLARPFNRRRQTA